MILFIKEIALFLKEIILFIKEITLFIDRHIYINGWNYNNRSANI